MSLPDGFTIRRASTDDLETIVGHRRAMFRDMGYSDEVALDSMAARFRVWLRQHMDAGNYLAWVVTAADGEIAAGAGLWLMDWPSHMLGKGGPRGNILNVYTADRFRRLGLARQLMEAVVQWCRENCIEVVILHASPAGRSLYESLVFKATNEMRINLV